MSETKARNVHAYTTINAVAATVSPGEQARLAANPNVAEVVPDQIINLAAPTTRHPVDLRHPHPACPARAPPTPSKPELTPQALSLIHADSSNPTAKTARSLGIDGRGVTVAYIADGVDTNNPDFIRPNGQHVFTDYEDFTGTGTAAPTGGEEAFIDSSSIAAQGTHSYNISNYSALPLSKPCYVRVEGVAPGANLVGLIAFTGELRVQLDHPPGHRLRRQRRPRQRPQRVVRRQPVPRGHGQLRPHQAGRRRRPPRRAPRSRYRRGDAGVTNTTGSPADDPNVIGVGATTSYEVDAQLGYGGFQFPGVTGFLNNNISSFSSSGFTQNGSILSVVAPGELNWVLCTPNLSLFAECANFAGQPTPVLEGGGTSESAPLTAGVAALVIQAYEKTHGGNAPTPGPGEAVHHQHRRRHQRSRRPAGQRPGRRLPGRPGRRVLPGPGPGRHAEHRARRAPSQFNAVAGTGTPESFTEQLTNLGPTSQTVNLPAGPSAPTR